MNNTSAPARPPIDKIIAFENGELDAESTLALFANLVNSGLAWQLQGSYGRTAKALIDRNLIAKDDSGTWQPCPENLE